jgi:asparagine synthase (glutamine-hydrolysing)
MLLRDADANGMAFGLEIRVPYLDRRVLDLAHSISGSLRCPRGQPGKHLLRASFKDMLRPDVLTQRKRGFVLPIWKWMAGHLRTACEARLTFLKMSGVVHPDGVEAVWNSFLANPTHQVCLRALSLIVLGDFLERTSRIL